MIRQTFFDPIFRSKVIFYVCKYQEMEQETGNKLADLDGAVMLFPKRVNGGDVTDYVVWIRDPEFVVELAHECLHLVKHLFKDHSVPFSDWNDEMIAYYQGYYFDRMLQAIKRSQKNDGKIKNVDCQPKVGGAAADLGH